MHTIKCKLFSLNLIHTPTASRQMTLTEGRTLDILCRRSFHQRSILLYHRRHTTLTLTPSINKTFPPLSPIKKAHLLYTAHKITDKYGSHSYKSQHTAACISHAEAYISYVRIYELHSTYFTLFVSISNKTGKVRTT